MRDEVNRNPLAVTGTPALVTGALTVDTDQALSFNGTTNSATAADSASLSFTGSMSIELFVKLSAYPGSAQHIVNKTNSYAVQIDTTGHVHFLVSGGSFVDVASNVALSLNTWYHIVCVYNNGPPIPGGPWGDPYGSPWDGSAFSGLQQFGKTTTGSDVFQVDDDNGNNKTVSKFTLVEPGILRNVNLSLKYVDEVWPVQMRAVVYADAVGSPGALVTTSDVLVLYPPNPQHRVWTWVNFALEPEVVPAGYYHIGYVADTTADISKAPLVIGREPSGGTTTQRPDGVSGPSDPFVPLGGSFVSNSSTLAAYCDYTAIARTGEEGKAVIYINGARNVSAAYTAGIADNANALQICPTLAAQVDEISVWNKALSPVQIATHYTAH